ncbi:hypothetical protein CUMW_259530 [Citrus unshiu]|uniref:Uncharacterized protein n=1 Tax=Citrus unshiu TaxID=55188 RepID=A0A2H5QU49_CITUN|nr:hypothetical protein CUMW_259530 [Citrus unshiu]
MMLVLSFVLGHVLRRHKFYYLPEASASLLIGLIVGVLANISNTETNIRAMSLVRSHASSGQNFFMIVREFEEWTKKSWRIDSDLQTVEMKMQKISRSVKEMELAQQAVYSKKKKVSWSW